MYLLQKHFWNHVLPAVRPSGDVHRRCVTQKNAVWQEMEGLLAKGLDMSLDIIIARCKLFLAQYQDRADFSPADDSNAFQQETSTQACSVCVRYLRTQARDIMACLNGQNLEQLLQELAVRFHSALQRHCELFTANELGGMLLSRDLHEYEKCVNVFENKFADELFAKFREASAVRTRALIPHTHRALVGAVCWVRALAHFWRGPPQSCQRCRRLPRPASLVGAPRATRERQGAVQRRPRGDRQANLAYVCANAQRLQDCKSGAVVCHGPARAVKPALDSALQAGCAWGGS